MKRGLYGLATVASIAPWLGMLGTLDGIANLFKGCGCERTAWMLAIVGGMSEALVPTALGLLVAIPAQWGYRHLSDVVEEFDFQMQDATAELVSLLRLHLARTRRAGR